jgi:carboxymethylenebutenolidase
LWNDTAPILSQFPNIVAAVLYADAADASSIASADTVAAVHHFAGSATGRPRKTSLLTEYYYPAVASYRFAIPFGDEFHYTTEAVSHTRNLTLLKRIMGGPYFDLETIWEEHTYYEFADRSVEHTMSTMVQEPYVNHVPTVSKAHQISTAGQMEPALGLSRDASIADNTSCSTSLQEVLVGGH